MTPPQRGCGETALTSGGLSLSADRHRQSLALEVLSLATLQLCKRLTRRKFCPSGGGQLALLARRVVILRRILGRMTTRRCESAARVQRECSFRESGRRVKVAPRAMRSSGGHLECVDLALVE